MLTEQEIVKKLYDQAAMFDHHYRRREYLQAALCADQAAQVALFVRLDGDRMAELFGSRQSDEPVEGLIREDKRIKAGDWCTYHGYARTRHTYRNVQLLIKK